MNKLTHDEIQSYIKKPNPKTGVRGISIEELEAINLDEVKEIEIHNNIIITDKDGKPLFKYDNFTPKAGSIYSKPSFAGSQILMGRIDRKLYFSNGNWFVI